MRRLLLISLVLLLVSCVRESKMYYRQYSIKNNSNYSIKLEFYTRYNKLLFKEIYLKNSETFEGALLESDQPPSNDLDNSSNLFASYSSDSLIVNYNNERKSTIYYVYSNTEGVTFSDPINRNVYRHGNYSDIGNDNFQFTFTEEDYNNAEDCDGDCD